MRLHVRAGYDGSGRPEGVSVDLMVTILLESVEFSVVINLLLTGVAGGIRWQQPFHHALAIFAESSNFGTIAKFALTPEATQNVGISASG